MFAQIIYPATITPAALDTLLEKGWFRMRQTVFTTHFLCFQNRFYDAIWLRVVLANIGLPKEQKKLKNRFRVVVAPTVITPELETLYSLYLEQISFELSETLEKHLQGTETHNRFNTHTVHIYDGDLLIAAGFFDIGQHSAEGITNIYHPDYKKYSPGKLLIHLKMDYCKGLGLHYFYPGYFAPGYGVFDYKLTIGTAGMQYLHITKQAWLPIANFNAAANPLQIMVEKLQQLHTAFTQKNIRSHIWYYRYFDANLDAQIMIPLFDFPVFLSLQHNIEDEHLRLVVYNFLDEKFHLLQCTSIIDIDTQITGSTIFGAHLLKTEGEFFASASIAEMIEATTALEQMDQL
ncbi:GNAT family N-acetyltransferase [Limnovirga soli]|uniref:N-end rule aminoacyl transferase C-terminal domain-containing protein n=1 Tax=Limnovirga soli TaxID=2656915 RepID=A0A8J8FHP4_9BACT|nr:GNAT family N-acetyltransferase [Limnovirga soli]NNV55254.1 hypothetical protein [Limnovirga soli]